MPVFLYIFKHSNNDNICNSTIIDDFDKIFKRKLIEIDAEQKTVEQNYEILQKDIKIVQEIKMNVATTVDIIFIMLDKWSESYANIQSYLALNDH